MDTILKKDKVMEMYPDVLSILLIDRTTSKNIMWLTDSYNMYGIKSTDRLNERIIIETNLVKPRIEKSKDEQEQRIKNNAEVFTPSWICNSQNNLIDNAWFGYENVFNKERNNSWERNDNKIEFPDGKTWLDYVKDIRLEITCGEAPYLVSRYDTVTGHYIDVKDRIGLFDRKMRVINENCNDKENWVKYSIEALKAIYGYEWQGDNLFLARENILLSYLEYYHDRFNELPNNELVEEVANIISWNIWQMDGIKGVIPNSCQSKKIKMVNLFGEEIIEETGCIGCRDNTMSNHNGIYCKIMDWEKGKKITYVGLFNGGK